VDYSRGRATTAEIENRMVLVDTDERIGYDAEHIKGADKFQL